MAVGQERWLDMYKTMIKIRKFEETALEYRKREIVRGAIHTCVGQEAVAVGVCFSLEPTDYTTSTHRGHGHCIAKGGKIDRMMAELFGKKTGYCKGKGGSMHIVDHSTHNLGANGIVGGGIPVATGVAVGLKYYKRKEIVVCFFGDGAANQGTFHEAVNLASIWKLPVLFVCENNGFGMGTRPSYATNVLDIAVRAQAYNIPGVTIDGNDVLAVAEAAGEAVKHVRAGNGPLLLECKTYRMLGHYQADKLRYRDEKEVEEWKKRDPINLFKKVLTEHGLLDDKLDAAIRKEVQMEFDAACKFAEESEFPPAEEARHDLMVRHEERVVG